MPCFHNGFIVAAMEPVLEPREERPLGEAVAAAKLLVVGVVLATDEAPPFFPPLAADPTGLGVGILSRISGRLRWHSTPDPPSDGCHTS